MKRVVFVVLAALISLLILSFAVPASAEETVKIAGGDRYIILDPGGDQACTMGAVGYDKFGNKVGLTAGHCSVTPNAVVVTNDRKPLGHFANAVARIEGQGVDGMDYGFVLFNDNVVLGDNPSTPPNPMTIVPAQALIHNGGLAIACKFGWGQLKITDTFIPINNNGERCGTVYSVNNIYAASTIAMFFGDSGGPVYWQRNKTQLIGITSRLADYKGGFMVFQRADTAVADITRLNGVGAGFVPVA